MKQWYEKLFENYANNYEKENFTQGTFNESNFIEKVIQFDKNLKILDVGCGTGRHSIELTKRGYEVVGFDLSQNQIDKAKENSKLHNLEIEFLIKDARTFSFEEKFDLAIMICEGAFSLMETDEMNFEILKNVYNSLTEGGKFIFTTLNALFPLFHSVKDFIEENGENFTQGENSFDLMTFREISEMTFKDDSEKEYTIHSNERFYTPSEISWLLKSLKFRNIEIYGGTVGNFEKIPLTTNHFEMLVICEK
jgi:SAM-dependent methyltransferase